MITDIRLFLNRTLLNRALMRTYLPSLKKSVAKSDSIFCAFIFFVPRFFGVCKVVNTIARVPLKVKAVINHLMSAFFIVPALASGKQNRSKLSFLHIHFFHLLFKQPFMITSLRHVKTNFTNFVIPLLSPAKRITIALLLMLASASFLQAQTLTSDQADYSPGTTATLTGSGFQAGETVVVQVLHYDGTSDGGEDHQPWEVIADENGNFTTTWHVCEDDCVGSLLKATADGQTSGLHAETTFTDAIHITSISLTSGSTNGGTLVTITGNGLNNNLTYQVAFGTTTVPGTWVDNQHITATTPAHIAGQVTVMVTATASNGNTSSDFINNAYTYVCATITATAVITQAKCHGDDASVTVTATGGTGAYTGTGTFPLADGTSSTYTVSDANGCSGVSNSVKANSPSQVVATAVITQALCHGGDASVTVSATGGTGAYTGTGTFSLADGTSSTYTVHDANNCAATSNSVTANSPSQVVAIAVITQALCHGGDASVTVSATGGTGAYTGTGTFSLADGTSSTYTVHDANNCSATSNSVTASNPSQVVATAVITQALCHGDPSSVTVSATGGTGAYTGTGTFSLADGTSSTYTVHDANNCSATSNSVTASSPSQVVATAVITQAKCHGDDASVTVTATGGTGAYTGTGTFSLADGTSLTYTVHDANNCAATSNSVTANSPSPINPHCSINNPQLYFGYTGDQSATVKSAPTGGVGPYTITIKMTRPLLCNQITSAGDEIWTPGANTNSSTGIVTCPTSGGPTVGSEPSSTSSPVSSYSVNVTLMKDALFHITVVDANGCKAECDTALSAEDVRCFAGNSSIKKYTICHQTGNSKSPCVSICVDSSALAEHLAHGDFLGACPKNGCSPAISSSSSSSVSIATIPASKAFNVKIMNNPSFGGTEFRLTVEGDAKEPVNISVTDMYGQRVFTTKGTANDTYRFGTGFSSGTYIVQVMQGKDIKTYKVV